MKSSPGQGELFAAPETTVYLSYSPDTGRPIVCVRGIDSSVIGSPTCLKCGAPRREKKGFVCLPCYRGMRRQVFQARCTLCLKEFPKIKYEYEKALRIGIKDFYCSRECSQRHHAVKNKRMCSRCKAKPTPKKTSKYCTGCKPAISRKRLAWKACGHCGSMFNPISYRAQYCGKECSSRAHSRRMRGEGNSHHRHGRSYNILFVKMSKVIHERDRTCVVCNAARSKNGRALVVHHIDENPWNNTPENLILVCSTCHMMHHKSSVTPFPWFAAWAQEVTKSMTSRLKDTATSLLTEYSSTTA